MSKVLRFSWISIGLLMVLLWRVGVAQASSGWSVSPSPNPVGDDTLFAVAAISTSDVWAVGSSNQGSATPHTLTEHWNGSSWSVIASPNAGPTFNKLLAVTAISSSNVWAVGYYQTNSGSVQTLVEHWNGSAWSVVTSANSSAPANQLFGVTAVSATDVWAVGSSQFNNTTQSLAEHWNGSSWSVVASPNPGSSFTSLRAVAAVSSNNVWAVGSYINLQGIPQTLTERWNGTKWSMIASANPGVDGDSLSGVARIPGSSQLWAVGDTFDSTSGQPLTERWNGSKWSVVASPTIQANASVLSSVTVLSSTNVWAVGQAGTPAGVLSNGATSSASNAAGKTLTEHWNGSKWSVVASPNPGTFNNGLNGVARVPGSTQLWAVGAYNNGTPPVLTVIEVHP